MNCPKRPGNEIQEHGGELLAGTGFEDEVPELAFESDLHSPVEERVQ